MFGEKLKVKEAAKYLCQATDTWQLFSLAAASASSTYVRNYVRLDEFFG